MALWSREDADILFSPWVMRSAWNKVLDWYSSGEWYDPAEMLAWKADPWKHLADLALDLAEGAYRPEVFPEIPYPKKGGYTRHYVMPSIRDQVAFMVFLVLLGPLFEGRMPNTSFGNRLYRPRVLKTPLLLDEPGSEARDRRKRWFRAPFSLSHTHLYTGFSSSYGLFRRLLQWLVNSVVLGEPDRESGRVLDDLSTEDPDLLPYHDFLSRSSIPSDLLYARLDLKTAYPSIDRQHLTRSMTALMTSVPGSDVTPRDPDGAEQCSRELDRCWYAGAGRPTFPDMLACRSRGFSDWVEPERETSRPHPWRYLASKEDLRLKLTGQLAHMVGEISYAAWRIPRGWRDNVHSLFPCTGCDKLPECSSEVRDEKRTWSGPHGLHPLAGSEDSLGHLIDNRSGVPTGLAVSGFLLNVALTPVDETMCTLSDRVHASGRLLCYLRFVDDIVLLAQDPTDLETAVVALANSVKRFAGDDVLINSAKAKPAGVMRFLEDFGKGSGNSLGLPKMLKRSDYLTRENLELFTTSIVREMSGLADETLEERYGASGIDRLEQLMELATLEIEDFEVGADARLSFSVNKLARAGWPTRAVVCEDRVVQPEAYVRKILLIAETALRRHPWRFKLWRSILIIAIRASRPFYKADYGYQWLREVMLPLVRWTATSGEGQRPSDLGWETLNVEDGCESLRWARDLASAQYNRCRERASFHRSEVLREWEYCVRSLQRVADNDDETPPKTGWLRFFSAGNAKEALRRFFPRIEDVVDGLYGDWEWRWNGEDDEPFLWWWESEALCSAALATLPPTKRVLRRLGPPAARALRDPKGISLPYIARVLGGAKPHPVQDRMRKALIRTFQYPGYQPKIHPQNQDGKLSGLWLSAYLVTRKVGRVALEFTPSVGDPNWAAWGRVSLWDSLYGRGVVDTSTPFGLPQADPRLSSLWLAFLRLEDYFSIRRLLMAHGLDVTFGLFAGWFPAFEGTHQTRRDRLHDTSLHCGVYLLDQQAGIVPLASDAPAIGVEPSLAWEVYCRLEAHHDAISFIAPATVLLTEHFFDSLVAARNTELVYGNERTFLEVNLAEDPLSRVMPLAGDSPAPHPLFLMPALLFADQQRIWRWQDAVLLLWMLEGGESILNEIQRSAPWQLPLADRDDIRSRFLLPDFVWSDLETALGMSRPRHDAVTVVDLDEIPDERGSGSKYGSVSHVVIDESGDWQVVQTMAPSAEPTKYIDEVVVRLVQPVAHPVWKNWMPSTKQRPFFSITQDSVGGMWEEMSRRLEEAHDESRLAPEFKADGRVLGRENLIMFPEWYADKGMTPDLRQFCRETGVAVLCGLLPREIPRAVPVVRSVKKKGLRCLVNEAVLMLPDYQPREAADPFPIPSKVHQFLIRKCCPNVSEVGLLKTLESLLPDTRWRFVGGQRWYCFHYPGWGAFCITICSDVLTSGKWRELYGQIQHLFIPAFNKDIDLFEQVTWTRGYELYANAVTANHGVFGGSVVWSPKHGYGKEVFRVHGPQKGLAIVVGIPVKALVEAQNNEYGKSLKVEHREWRAKCGDPQPGTGTKSGFKTPRPRVVHKGSDGTDL